MANEATVQSQLTISKTVGSKQIQFNNLPNGSFTADVAGSGGPSPGTVLASATGSKIDLKAQLSDPSLYIMYNVGTVPIDWGIWEPTTNKFFLLNRLLPGESYVGRFSPFLFGDIGSGTAVAGTGTIGNDNNQLYIRGAGGVGYLNISAFDQ